MRKMQFTLIMLLCVVLALSLVACSKTQEVAIFPESEMSDSPEISLTEREELLLGLVEADITVITDEDYAVMIDMLTSETDSYSGQLFQLEGLYLDGETPYVARALSKDGTQTSCGLPLDMAEEFQKKQIPEYAWIRVTGILNYGEVDGETATVLEVIAIESLSQRGQIVVTWNENSTNNN